MVHGPTREFMEDFFMSAVVAGFAIWVAQAVAVGLIGPVPG